jgi:hypothetical protein
MVFKPSAILKQRINNGLKTRSNDGQRAGSAAVD